MKETKLMESEKGRLIMVVFGIALTIVVCIIAKEIYANTMFPLEGVWYLSAETRSYLIKIDQNAMVSYWKKSSQSWCEYGHALILQEILPIREPRNMFLLIKIKGDYFTFPYSEDKKEFTGICQIFFKLDLDGYTAVVSQAQKCSMWRPEDTR